MSRASEGVFRWGLGIYRKSLRWMLQNPGLVLTTLVLIIALNVVIAIKIPKGFFPQQDTGALQGDIRGPQDSSFPAMNVALQQIEGVINRDQAVQNVIGFVGGGATNTGMVNVVLKPVEKRDTNAAGVINRLRPQAEPDHRGVHVSTGRAGHPCRRTRRQRDVPVHHPVGQRERPTGVGAEAAGRDHTVAGLSGRKQRPAERRAGPALDLRPGDGGEAWAECELPGLGALFGVRPVPGIADLYPIEPVLRCAGSCTPVLGDPRWPEDRVPASVGQELDGGREHASAQRGQGTGKYDPPVAESHRPVSLGDGVFQSGAGTLVERRDVGHRPDAAGSGRSPDGALFLRGNGAGVSTVAGQRAHADRDGPAGCLHRSGDSVREPGASADHHLHAALGQRRRHAGVDALPPWT